MGAFPGERESGGRYSLRKRKANDKAERKREDKDEFYALAKECDNLVVFSGSGMSVASGLSTFTSRGGLYERATKKFKVSDGMKLFCNKFYVREPVACLSFLSEIFLEACDAKPTKSHSALAQLEEQGRMVRHYTLNIDGLHRYTTASLWTGQRESPGKTVELHGNCREVVCVSCKRVTAMSVELAKRFHKATEQVLCEECEQPIRPKIMLYDDADGEDITPDVVMEVMDEDIAKADLILWVGISFQQSASLEYFRNIQRVIKDSGKESKIVQAIVNPDDTSYFNAISGSNNIDDFKVIFVESHCDAVLTQLVTSWRPSQ